MLTSRRLHRHFVPFRNFRFSSATAVPLPLYYHRPVYRNGRCASTVSSTFFCNLRCSRSSSISDPHVSTSSPIRQRYGPAWLTHRIPCLSLHHQASHMRTSSSTHMKQLNNADGGRNPGDPRHLTEPLPMARRRETYRTRNAIRRRHPCPMPTSP